MLTIIGCGNSNRGDDGVGVYVAQRLIAELQDQPRNGVRIHDAGTGGMEVMFQARGSDHLVLVDACNSGAEAGAIFEVPGDELAQLHAPNYSLHDFRWDHALAAGRKIYADEFPSRVTVYLVQVQNLGLCLELSAKVRQSADVVLQKIRAEILAHAA